MSELSPGSLPPNSSGEDTVAHEPRGIERPRRRASDRIVEDAAALTRFEQDQLAREFADIERASAALRLGEPTLHSWSRTALPAVPHKPRPLWLLIGVLWLSTAIVTVGAVAAIATLAG